jgi:TrpR-related protein YerC/YecD
MLNNKQIWDTPTAKQLSIVLASIDDISIMQNVLRDVMTEKEIIEISSRLEAARMLELGKKYTEVIEKTKLSSRTVARISEWMKNGQNGYKEALKITSAHHDHIPPARAE